MVNLLHDDFPGDSGKDGITIADGSNMIFDHVSVSWGRDETFSINGTMQRVVLFASILLTQNACIGDVYNVTISDSIVAQGLDTHSCGGLIQTSTGGVSIIRSLYIDNKTRNPKVKGVNEFINNVVRLPWPTPPPSPPGICLTSNIFAT